MPRLPKDRRGLHETLDHYLQRLDIERKKRLHQSYRYQMGLFLAGFDWNYFCTYTFETPMSEATAVHLLNEHLLCCGQSCYAYFSVELNRTHIHALVHCPDLPLKNVWPFGWFDISPYDRSRGAVFYVNKSQSFEWHWFGTTKREHMC